MTLLFLKSMLMIQVFGYTSNNNVEEFIDQIKKEFEMSIMGEFIDQMKKEFIHIQIKYDKNPVKKFGLETTKHMRTPKGTNIKLTKDENSSNVDPTLYKSIICSFLYLTSNHPDIC